MGLAQVRRFLLGLRRRPDPAVHLRELRGETGLAQIGVVHLEVQSAERFDAVLDRRSRPAHHLVVLAYQALAELGSIHALVLHSEDGLDEVSIVAPTRGFELRDTAIHPIEIVPEAYGHAHDSLEGLQVSTPVESAQLIRGALGGETSPVTSKARSIITLNAGAGIYVSGVALTLAEGMAAAEAAIASGAALEKIEAFVALTQALGGISAEAPRS